LQEVCQEKGLDPQSLLDDLEASAFAPSDEPEVDPASMSLTQLADHIIATHHDYLRREFARLEPIMQKVARVHGENDGESRGFLVME
jgi:regulator of cell morphogenesis and NO signaling